MRNRNLTSVELNSANKLLTSIRKRLEVLSGGDKQLLFAYRRKIYKELTYDERSKPMARRKLKIMKRKEQNGLCVGCSGLLPEKYAILDRIKAADGYSAKNTRLICQKCDTATQLSRRYA